MGALILVVAGGIGVVLMAVPGVEVNVALALLLAASVAFIWI